MPIRLPRGLHVALTWRYMLVTVAALLIVELLGLLALTRLRLAFAYNMQPDISTMFMLTETAADYLETGESAELHSWLQTLRQPVINLTRVDGWLRINRGYFPVRRDQVLMIWRPGEGVVAITPPDSPYRDLRDLAELPGPLGDNLLSSIPPRPGENGVTVHSGNQSLAVSPIRQADGSLLGMLILLNSSPDEPPSLAEVLAFIGLSVLVLTTIVGALGGIFGFLSAGFLVRRINHLAVTTADWGLGDFSRPLGGAHAPNDEIDELAQHLNRLRSQIQHLLRQREQWAVAEERNRVARELHDSVKQQVFTLRMHLATAQTLAAQGNDQAAQFVQSAATMAQQAQDELTSIIQLFHTRSGAPQSFTARIDDLVADWSRQSQIVAQVSRDETLMLPVDVEHALLRVLQEALANVYKHSKASSVQVQIHQRGQVVALEVLDDGRGFDATVPQAGIGLSSMRERVELLGGRLDITSGARGTQVVVQFPIEREVLA